MIDVSDPGEQRGIAALLAVMQVSYDRSTIPAFPRRPLKPLSPEVKRDAVKLVDAPASSPNGNLTATEPAR